MSKRQQTTAIPKPKQRSTEEPGKSRVQREAEIQRYIIIGTIVTVAVVAAILLISVIIELVVVPNQAVASVNGTNITVSQFENRVRLERTLLNNQINDYIFFLQSVGQDPNQYAGQEPLRTWLSQIQIPDQLGNRVINDMVTDLLIRQEAAERGITVSEEEIDRAIGQALGYDPETAGLVPTLTLTPTITPTPFVSPTPSPEPTLTPVPVVEVTEETTAEATAETASEASPTWTPQPTPTATATLTAEEEETQFTTNRDEYFANLRRVARISDSDIRTYFENQALRDKLADAINPELTTSLTHVNARHILVATQEEAQDILTALQAGESFANLAKASSTDTSSGANGGELDWTPITSFVDPFSEAVREAPIGEIIGPVETEFGWHIIQVRAREEREVTQDEIDAAKERRLTSYLEEKRAAEAANIEIYPVWTENIPSDPVFLPGQPQ